jgi:hypothetical protein
MNAHTLRTLFGRRNLVATFAALLSLVVLGFGFAAHTARPTQDGQGESEPTERKFENAIPAHVPLKVKLKSEKSFKDLENKGWARELELEVKNTGSKPIHYLYVVFLLPDSLLEDGLLLSLPVSYGKNSLSELSTPLRPEETPIPPGESITLKIQEKYSKAYEILREERKWRNPKRVRLELQILEYGDGTGFEGVRGDTMLPQPKKSSLDKPPAPSASCKGETP